MRSIPSLRSFPNAACETVPMFVWLTMVLSRPIEEDRFSFIVFILATLSFRYFDGILPLLLSVLVRTLQASSFFLSSIWLFHVATWKVHAYYPFNAMLRLFGIHCHWISVSPRRCHLLKFSLKHSFLLLVMTTYLSLQSETERGPERLCRISKQGS